MIFQKCKRHPEVDAIHVDNATNDPLCVWCTVDRRRTELDNAEPGKPPLPSVVGKYYSQALNMSPGQHRARLCFQVAAGLVPGQPLAEFNEEWWLDSETYQAMIAREDMTPDHPDNLFARARDEAHWYAQQLTDPRVVNWVRVEFVYF